MTKNRWVKVLMGLSMILLITLQALWIQSSYLNEVTDLRRTSSNVFRNTVFQVRDSVSFKNFKFQSDTSNPSFISRIEVNRDSIKVTQQTSSVQVFISSTGPNDSIINLLQPITKDLSRRKTKSNFTFRIAAEKLNLDTLHHYFVQNLEREKIFVKCEVKELEPTIPSINNVSKFNFPHFNPPIDEYRQTFQNSYNDTLLVAPVRFNPVKGYSAKLYPVNGFVIKKIAPEILFALFLTLLTGCVFWIMYKNIRTQQRLMELKNDFISNVAHELKTPVTTVGVALEALKNFKGLDNPKLTEEYLDIAQKELNRLTLLTDKILKTAIFENKGIHFEPEPVQLDQLIEQVLSSMKLVFDKQGAKLNWQKTGDDFQVMGGSVHLMSVIYNLLDNALKYSPAHPDIKVELKRESGALILAVQDNGLGISSEYQKKIFEKFFRVPTGDVHNIKGYGLGLSYVQSVMKAHAGKIEVESKVGAGSKFILTFPIATA